MAGKKYVWFEPDHVSFGEFIMSDQMRDPVTEVAQDIAGLAARLAPRDSTPDGTPMADQFRVNRNAGAIRVNERYPSLRVKVEVFNSDQAAAPNEFGGRGGAKNKRHRMLGRAGAAYGDFKAGKGKKLR